MMPMTRFIPLPKRIRPCEGFYTLEVQSPRRLPVLTFLPTGYEPNYAYPLVIFFHGSGSSEAQLVRLAPRLSRRNYICIGLRGPEISVRRDDGAFGYSWGTDWRSEAYAEEYVFGAIEQTCSLYNTHPDRIFLVGLCEGATLAYRLGLAYPHKFAGVISLNGTMPHSGPLFRFPEIRRLRVLIGHGIANSIVPLSTARRDYRLLYTAGLPVQFRTYLTTNRIHSAMLRDMNHWMMRIVTDDEPRIDVQQ